MDARSMSSLMIVPSVISVTNNADDTMVLDLCNFKAFDEATIKAAVEYCLHENKELWIIAPLEHGFLDPLVKMGFDKIEKTPSKCIVLKKDKSQAPEDDSQQPTTLARANDLPEVASDFTPQMQRENIASSRNPYQNQTPVGAPGGPTPRWGPASEQAPWGHYSSQSVPPGMGNVQDAPDDRMIQRQNIESSSNPYPNQTPVGAAWPGVQPPGLEAVCERGQAEFQLSNRALPSIPVDIGNGNEAAGLRGGSAGPEIPVRTKKRPHPVDESEPPPTRPRGENHTGKEKVLLFKAKYEFIQNPENAGNRHKWLLPATKIMKDNGLYRKEKVWNGLWDTLLKNRHKYFPKESTADWFLAMDNYLKSASKKFDELVPPTSELGWDGFMERICKLKPRTIEKEIRGDGQEDHVHSQSRASTVIGPDSANFTGAGSSVQQPRQASALESDEDLQASFRGWNATWSLTKKDNQETFATVEKQAAVLQVELNGGVMESGGADFDPYQVFDYNRFSAQIPQSELADADQAGCDELESSEYLH